MCCVWDTKKKWTDWICNRSKHGCEYVKIWSFVLWKVFFFFLKRCQFQACRWNESAFIAWTKRVPLQFVRLQFTIHNCTFFSLSLMLLLSNFTCMHFVCVCFFLSCCFDCVLFVASKGLNAQYSKTIFEQQRYFNYRASWFLVLLSHILCYFLKLILSMYNTTQYKGAYEHQFDDRTEKYIRWLRKTLLVSSWHCQIGQTKKKMEENKQNMKSQ